MLVTRELLTRMGASAAHADRHLDALNAAMALHGIDTELRIAHFLAQVMHESGCLRLTEENLNYSAEGLRRVFRKYYRSDAEAAADARPPEPPPICPVLFPQPAHWRRRTGTGR